MIPKYAESVDYSNACTENKSKTWTLQESVFEKRAALMSLSSASHALLCACSGNLPLKSSRHSWASATYLSSNSTACQAEVCLQMSRVQRQGLQTVPQRIVVIAVPDRNRFTLKHLIKVRHYIFCVHALVDFGLFIVHCFDYCKASILICSEDEGLTVWKDRGWVINDRNFYFCMNCPFKCL